MVNLKQLMLEYKDYSLSTLSNRALRVRKGTKVMEPSKRCSSVQTSLFAQVRTNIPKL